MTCKTGATCRAASRRGAFLHGVAKNDAFLAGQPPNNSSHDAGKPTTSVAKLAQNRILCADSPRDSNGKETETPTPRVATRQKDAIFGTYETKDANGHNVLKTNAKRSDAAHRYPSNKPNLLRLSTRMSSETTLKRVQG